MAKKIIKAVTKGGHELPVHVTPDGTMRLLASVNQGRHLAARPFRAVETTIPRSSWRPFDRTHEDVPIMDQKSEGSCVAHGSTAMVERARSASGQPFVQLARAYLYALINNGADGGADPADAMTALQTKGICTEAACPYKFLVERQLTKPQYDEGLRFAIEPASIVALADFDEMVSAELLGYKTGYTVYVAGDWNTLDRDGCPPSYRGQGNHWMSSADGIKQTSAGEWLLKVRQSWGTGWGMDGFAYVRESHFTKQPGVQMYGLKWAGQDPLDPNRAPVAA